MQVNNINDHYTALCNRTPSAHAEEERTPIFIALDFDGVLHPSHGSIPSQWTENVASGKWNVADFKKACALDYADDAARYVADFGGKHDPESAPRFVFERSNVLEMVLELYPEIRLVIATAWRQGMSLESLRSLMPPRLAERVVGKLDDALEKIDHRFISGIRGELMGRWMIKNNHPHDAWLAIDDEKVLWSTHPQQLVQPHFWHGLQAPDAHLLMSKLDKIRAKKSVTWPLHAWETGDSTI